MLYCSLTMTMHYLIMTFFIFLTGLSFLTYHVSFNHVFFQSSFAKSGSHKMSRTKSTIPTEVDILVVGAGLSGAIIAQQYAEHFPHLKILVIDKRSHIGGNCYDYVEADTGIRVNQYGIHLFHTNYDRVWNYTKTKTKKMV